jgi:hypothetical protein
VSTQFNSSAPRLISRQAGVPKLDSSLHSVLPLPLRRVFEDYAIFVKIISSRYVDNEHVGLMKPKPVFFFLLRVTSNIQAFEILYKHKRHLHTILHEDEFMLLYKFLSISSFE